MKHWTLELNLAIHAPYEVDKKKLILRIPRNHGVLGILGYCNRGTAIASRGGTILSKATVND
jgi:hypothetical protein